MPSRKQPIFWEGIGRGKEKWSTVQGKWKLIASPDLTQVQLFNIVTDVSETTDLSTKQPEVTVKLLQSIKNWQATLPKAPSGNVFSKLRK